VKRSPDQLIPGRNPGRTSAPRYAQLAQALSRQIQEGQHPVGALLPTEQSLCSQHGVSRVTVRGALRELERQGLISRRPRVGTRVLARTPQAVFRHSGDSIDGVLQFTQTLPFRCLSIEPARVDATRAERDGLPASEHFVEVIGLRERPSGEPVLYSVHLVPERHRAQLLAADGRLGSIPQALAQAHGEEIVEIRQQFDAVGMPTAAARALGVRPGTPGLRTRRWYRTGAGELLVMATTLAPQGRYVLTSVLRRLTD
jgi:DNA-binding GntR family transcriptional regulator